MAIKKQVDKPLTSMNYLSIIDHLDAEGLNNYPAFVAKLFNKWCDSCNLNRTALLTACMEEFMLGNLRVAPSTVPRAASKLGVPSSKAFKERFESGYTNSPLLLTSFNTPINKNRDNFMHYLYFDWLDSK